ncbi:hypothetical protein LTR66_014595 [Elasticomyces elasticus]|nr:hypothetical protein LTR66_014595 [Elasticomyces elasticus]
MGVFYETIPKSHIDWILAQKIFWVASAPLTGSGHVNVSPKGGAYFGVIDEKTFWYQELSGSGCETISHLYEPGNGRITIQFNAFEGPPRILRLWGKGRVLEHFTPEYDDFIGKHNIETLPGTRTIIINDIHQVGTSCGFSVPFYEFKEFRPTLNDFYEKREKKYIAGDSKSSMPHYWGLKSTYSMDGLPGMKAGLKAKDEYDIEPLKKMIGPFAPTKMGVIGKIDGFTLEQMIIVFVVAFIAGVMAVTISPDMLRRALHMVRSNPQAQTWLPRSMR